MDLFVIYLIDFELTNFDGEFCRCSNHTNAGFYKSLLIVGLFMTKASNFEANLNIFAQHFVTFGLR